ncbi:MAG TPA: hypothetical protein VH234_01030 [Candidatus Saccharimonadales bacterium]|jgi:hypothetical protein|nr:hypothetical protein [Candidatus Saccharimonadales bacterium]
MKLKKLNARGFSHDMVLVLFVVIFAIAGVGYLVASHAAAPSPCTQSAPQVYPQNTYAWATAGSWGLPGQKLSYNVSVYNADIGKCGSSTFTLSATAPSGYQVSVPVSSITLAPNSRAYPFVYVTSPTTATDGDNPIVFTLQRSGTSNQTASNTSYYKVYTTDTTPPTMYYSNPYDGLTISGHSYNLSVTAADDHATKYIEAYLDNNSLITTQNCDNTSYECQLYYTWNLKGVSIGAHTMTFKAYDWLGNMSSSTVNFTVGR